MLVSLLLFACHPSVTLTYLRPSTLTLPAELQTVSVVDRVGTDESREAVTALNQTLLESPRLKAVDAAPGQAAYGKAAGGELVGRPLQPATAAAVSEAGKSSGVVSLESVSAGGEWSTRSFEEQETEVQQVRDCPTCAVREVEVTKTVTVYEATYTAQATSSWSLYDKDGKLVDSAVMTAEDVIYGEGSEPGTAMAAAGDTEALEMGLVSEVGYGYAARIAPLPAFGEREYFKCGSSELREAHRALKEGDWERAEKLWTEASKSENEKVKGKALFNLALAMEAKGKLNKAIKYLSQAAALLGDKKVVVMYQAILADRKAENARLKSQMEQGGEK